jgi:hypothetical protein
MEVLESDVGDGDPIPGDPTLLEKLHAYSLDYPNSRYADDARFLWVVFMNEAEFLCEQRLIRWGAYESVYYGKEMEPETKTFLNKHGLGDYTYPYWFKALEDAFEHYSVLNNQEYEIYALESICGYLEKEGITTDSTKWYFKYLDGSAVYKTRAGEEEQERKGVESEERGQSTRVSQP